MLNFAVSIKDNNNTKINIQYVTHNQQPQRI